MNRLQNALDNELVSAFQQGNDQAMEELVMRYKDKIFTSLIYLTKNRELSEDLLQEVFIKIIDTLKDNRYNDEGKFLPWAVRIAHNLYIDYFRKHSKHQTINCADNVIFEKYVSAYKATESKISKQQTYDKLAKMLDQLPAEQREVVVLRHYADLSFKEISEITGATLNTCLGRMRYALINLRKQMDEYQIVL